MSDPDWDLSVYCRIRWYKVLRPPPLHVGHRGESRETDKQENEMTPTTTTNHKLNRAEISTALNDFYRLDSQP